MVTFIPRRESFLIFQGDDEDAIYALEREIDELIERAEREANTARRMLDATDTQAEIEAKRALHDELVKDATPRAIPVTVEALGRKAWKALVDAHPARDGNPDDAKSGINEDEFAEAVVRRSMVTPEFDRDADRDEFLDAISDAQFNRIYLTAVGLNRTVGASPKAMLSSVPSLSGDAISV